MPWSKPRYYNIYNFISRSGNGNNSYYFKCTCYCYYLVTNLVAIVEGADCGSGFSDGSSSEVASIESGEHLQFVIAN